MAHLETRTVLQREIADIQKPHGMNCWVRPYCPKITSETHLYHFSSIITISPTASRIKEMKDAYVLMRNKLQ